MAGNEDFPLDHDLSLEARQKRGRIWVDGCFDFVHHGHAGLLLQGRQLGTELFIGVHSDEAITLNKGPPVMDLAERTAAVDACRWSTQSVPHAPYVTDLAFIDGYKSWYVVHGDDVTADADGSDCYRYVKTAGRFLMVRRTPGISTTDLVARMLAGPAAQASVEDVAARRTGPPPTRAPEHHVKSLMAVLNGTETCPSGSGAELRRRIETYATDETGLAPGVPVWNWSAKKESSNGVNGTTNAVGSWSSLVPGKLPQRDQRIVYVDGGWDLFCSGHIAFLQAVVALEERKAREQGWYTEQAKAQREQSAGADYGPAYILLGVHTDADVNDAKGANYPIMSIFERGLCALQCRYISGLVFSVPRVPARAFLETLPFPERTKRHPEVVYHGPTTEGDVPESYREADEMGVFALIQQHAYQDVHAETIVARIIQHRELFEERQRIKGAKAVGEAELRGQESSRGATS